MVVRTMPLFLNYGCLRKFVVNNLPYASFTVFYQFPDLRKLISDVENAVFTSTCDSVNDLTRDT